MCKRCLYVFLAGALAMHTLGHVMLVFSNLLPLSVFGITVTQNLNYLIIVASAFLTGLCLYLARDYKCDCSVKR